MTDPVDPSRAVAHNPYAAPQADTSGAEPDALDLTFEEASAYVGPRHLKYWRAWRRTSAKNKALLGFNWAAMFFNLGWMLYRKMYREFLVGLGILFGIGVIQSLLESQASIDVKSIDRATNVAFGAACGMLGNALYLRKTRRAIAEARAREPDLAKRRELLARLGGCSWLGPIIGIAVSVAFTALAVALESSTP